MKTCPQCEQSLPLDAFAVATRKKDGRQAWCRACSNAKKRAAYAADPASGRASSAAWRARNPDRPRPQDVRPDWYLLDRYRMTLADYEARLAAQDGRCANLGCGAEPPDDRRFHVDHDHNCCPGTRSCGQCVRGLLCAPCNQALGNARDDVARLLGLADYLLGARDVIGSLS